MTNLLVIQSSPMGDASNSRKLVDTFVAQYTAQNGTLDIRTTDLAADNPKHLNSAHVAAAFTPPADRTAEQNEILSLSDQYVSDLKWADVIVIGSPMHNFTITSLLKSWIDHICRVGETFNYTENGPVGLLSDKKVFILTARGGDYSATSPAWHMNHQDPYLKTVFGFIGLTEVNFFGAEAVARGETGMEEATAAIQGANLAA